MAPLAATLAAGVAASVAVGVGLALARTERERRRARRVARERRLGLAPGEALGCGLRRMALGQIDLALELLRDEDGVAQDGCEPPSEEAVHETRKAIKRLRALLRLLEHELGERGFERENAALRDIARHLSRARDATVMLSTLDALIERHPRRLGRRRGVLALRRRVSAQSERVQLLTLADAATRAEVLGELRALRYRVTAWALPSGDGVELIHADLMTIYRQGRARHRRAARARGEGTLAMHMWRKRVKELRYAAEMLRRSDAPGRLDRLVRRADALGELLGEEHDLAVLAQHLRAGARDDAAWDAGRRTRETLLELIAKRRRRLRKQALRGGERLYAQTPKRFMRQVRAAHERGG